MGLKFDSALVRVIAVLPSLWTYTIKVEVPPGDRVPQLKVEIDAVQAWLLYSPIDV